MSPLIVQDTCDDHMHALSHQLLVPDSAIAWLDSFSCLTAPLLGLIAFEQPLRCQVWDRVEGDVCVSQQYWAGDADAYRFVPVLEFAAAFQKSEAGAAQAAALSEPFQVSKDTDRALAWAKHGLTGSHLPCLSGHCMHWMVRYSSSA